MKALFLSYSGYPQHSDNFIANPGPTILSTICNKIDGVESKVLDLNRPGIFIEYPNTQTLTDFLINKFEQDTPDLIGVTTWFNAYQDNAKIFSTIKEKFPKTLVVGGGYHATWFEESFLKGLSEVIGNNKPVFDMIIAGEGEKPIRDLIEYMNGKRKKQDISGAIYQEDGNIKRGKPQSFLKLDDLTQVPLPDWSNYQHLDEFWPMFMVDISRACYFSCIMCGHKAMSGNKVRSRNVKDVVDQIKKDIEIYGVKHRRITSPMFPKKLIEEFVNEVLGRDDLPEFYWSCFGEPKDLNDLNLLKKMKDSGCIAIFYGIESGNNEILKKLNKRSRKQDIEYAIENTKKAGIKAIGSIMIGNPYETEETIKETVEFILKIRPDSVPSVALVPIPRTELTNNPKKYGYKLHKDWRKGMMLLRVEHIQDPDKWDYPINFYTHPHNNKSFLDYAKICGNISRRLFDEGINRLTDDVYLMAHILGKDLNQAYVEHSTKLKQRDMQYFADEIKTARKRILYGGDTI